MPNIVKGSDMGGLLRYLAGPGRANEHTNPRVIAGDVVTMAVYAGAIDVSRATELAKLLDSPRQTVLRGEPVLVTNYRKAHAMIAEGTDRKEAFDAATRDQNVWHCALSLDPKDGQLDIDKWAMIARDFMREMGFTDSADGGPDVRWTTVHHGLTKAGGDHIHIAMSVVRPDGTLADVRRDWPRSQEATRILEHKHGLKVLASREDRTTEQATRPDERGRAVRVGAPETDREALRRRVRAAAVSAQDEAEFVRDLRADGMVLRPRYAKGGTDTVVGYAVRMPAQKNRETGSWEKAIWYGGGQLSKDLTLSALRGWAGWDESEQAREAALTEWQRAGATRGGRTLAPDRLAEAQSVSELSRWSQYMRTIPVEDHDAWAKAASQTAGVFAALSVRTETKPGPLDRLSRQLARAGQLPAHRRRPQNVHGPGLRHVARMLWAAQSPAASNLALMHALIECLLEIKAMLEATDRARSAAAMASEARKALT
ncbi:relaxase/mobilization nuclease domain-containing protein, partial [Streptomyces lydicus]